MPAGRPTDYSADLCEVARKVALLGATDVEIADILDIATSTLYLWKARYPEFSEALKIGKEHADARVVRSLYQRAVGYTFESEKIITVSKGNNMGSVVERHPCREHVPPDTTAGIFWLKNRDSENWRDKQEVNHSGNFTILTGVPRNDAD